ncbi:Carboxylesterase [Candidatus Methylobacter favarea]|uniref:Carboxylesterase n=1 Tax=Candidatus Methylobacter favarea TaxID=2707345 RepID=A0A8S0WPH1_9GAMM|nr:carboxylesterase [Candidatus Methylobacter favarea]CAA9890925.1 Carboxylesterase [Candidatus Methylobacter favarea]
MHSELSTYEIKPTSTHQYSIIWLHGLGADGHDFEDIVPKLHLITEPNIHFIFPNAPIQPITINGGKKMRAWFDILELGTEHKVDIAGIYQSTGLIDQLIQQEIDHGIPPENILLAGFSQGGTVALHAGLRYPYKLAGIIALSTYLPTLEQLKIQRPTANYATPIFMANGILDSIVAIEYGKKTSDTLAAMGYSVEWHDYLMEHTVCIEEIEHISAFINSILK